MYIVTITGGGRDSKYSFCKKSLALEFVASEVTRNSSFERWQKERNSFISRGFCIVAELKIKMSTGGVRYVPNDWQTELKSG